MEKRAFLIHGWEGYPEEGWRPWLKKKLEKRGFEAVVPTMPNTNYPVYQAWVKHLQKIVGKPQKNDYFVGHSLGCITILKEKLGAKLIIEHDKKHFSGDDNIFELPSALEAILESTK